MTAHANELAVDVRGLRKQYGDVTAVDGIDLGIYPARGGLRPARTQRRGQEHRVPAAVAPRARGARGSGIVWQDESAPAELTARETVRHFARYYPKSRDPEEVIGLVGLEEKAGSRIKALSGGQRRRPDVALGVIGGPELLLLAALAQGVVAVDMNDDHLAAWHLDGYGNPVGEAQRFSTT